MNTKRIDPAVVAAWFAAHRDVRPMRGSFGHFQEDGPLDACCGLFAAALAILGSEPDECMTATFKGATSLATLLGLSDPYAWGFAHGWDGSPGGPLNPDYIAGHDDGAEAWRFTKEALA